MSNSPLFLEGKNKFNLFSKNIENNLLNYSFSNNDKNKQAKEEELYKINNSDFFKEENRDIFPRNNNNKKPSTPILNHTKIIYNQQPQTYRSKNMNDKLFNNNLELKKNEKILQKDEKNIINNENTFNVGHKNMIKNRNKKNNSKNNLLSSRITEIFRKQPETHRNCSKVSIKNNIIQKTPIKSPKKESKKKNNNSFNSNVKSQKEKRPNSMKNNNINKKQSYNRNTQFKELYKDYYAFNEKEYMINNYNERKNYSSEPKKINQKIQEKKILKVQNRIELEINNLFQILPDDYEHDPEIKNNFKMIINNIHGLRNYINRKNLKSYIRKKIINQNKK